MYEFTCMEGHIIYVNTYNMRKNTYTINQEFFLKVCSTDLKFKK